MNILLKIYRRLAEPLWMVVKYSALDLFSKGILVNFWLPPRARPGHYNFGDDINLVVMRFVSGKRPVPYRFSLFRRGRVNFLCIGSIITQLSNRHAVVWGSGVISADSVLQEKPAEVLAVRGPLSRQFLIEHGVDCPEVYGDPALLLPRYYQPAPIGRKYRLGIIPHYKDKDHPLMARYRKMEDVCVLDVQDYGRWQSFIDTLCACECVVSSSLHGLIVADAYRVPNRWIEFSDQVQGAGFKFRDYFLSVNRMETPVPMNRFHTLQELIGCCADWKPAKIDLKPLLSQFPRG